MKVTAIYNPRNPNGDVSDLACDYCEKIGAAYISLNGLYICKGCLEEWGRLINKSILQDIMDSVQRRKEKESCLKEF